MFYAPLAVASLLAFALVLAACRRKSLVVKSAIILLFAGWTVLWTLVVLPGYLKTKAMANRGECQRHLLMLAEAKRSWGQRNNPPTNAIPSVADIAVFLEGRVLPTCPAGGTYTLGTVNEPPRCSHADKGHTLTSPR